MAVMIHPRAIKVSPSIRADNQQYLYTDRSPLRSSGVNRSPNIVQVQALGLDLATDHPWCLVYGHAFAWDRFQVPLCAIFTEILKMGQPGHPDQESYDNQPFNVVQITESVDGGLTPLHRSLSSITAPELGQARFMDRREWSYQRILNQVIPAIESVSWHDLLVETFSRDTPAVPVVRPGYRPGCWAF